MEESTSKVFTSYNHKNISAKNLKQAAHLVQKIYAAHPPYGKISNQIGNIPMKSPSQKTKNSPIHTVTNTRWIFFENQMNSHFTLTPTQWTFLKKQKELTLHTNTHPVNIPQETKGTHNSH